MEISTAVRAVPIGPDPGGKNSLSWRIHDLIVASFRRQFRQLPNPDY